MKPSVNPERFALALANSGHTRGMLARRLGFSNSGLWRRLTGRTAWTYPEVHLLAELLEVPEEWLLLEPSDVHTAGRCRDGRQLDLLAILESQRGAAAAGGAE